MDSQPTIQSLSIGRVATLAGVPLTTVRFYERANIVRPVGRNGANYRLYSPDAVARIRFTRRAQELGFTLGDVKELLALRSGGTASCKRVRATATAKIDDINARVRSLKRIAKALAKLAAECATQAGSAAARYSNTSKKGYEHAFEAKRITVAARCRCHVCAADLSVCCELRESK